MIFDVKLPNVDTTVIKLIKHLKIPISDKTIVEELGRHPDYPSLLSISDILKYHHITNGAFKISFEQLQEIPLPFIAQTVDNGGEFVLIENIENNQVTYDQNKMDLDRFHKKFNGNILVIDSFDEAGEINYNKNQLKDLINRLRTPLTISGLVVGTILGLIFLSNYFTSITWTVGLASTFKTVGLATSILLLIQSIDTNNPLIQKLCISGSNTNCTAILSSKASSVFDGLSWSEIGFFYFFGTWISLLFNSTSISILQILSILNILSLPYTIYSIYYQAKIAKQWCVLCCTIQALLWFEFFPLVTLLHNHIQLINLREIAILFINFSMPIILWMFCKPFFLKSQKAKQLENQLNKLKFNVDVFNKLLVSQPKFVTPDKDWSIVLGNPNAANIITMVSNPYCYPCANAHQMFDDWLKCATNIQLRIVFAVPENEEDARRILATHFMGINAIGDEVNTKRALSDWYAEKNFKNWAKRYPTEINEDIFLKLKKQSEWCEIAGISGTPTILINGYKLPKLLYRIDELKYLLSF